ncbi:hypothetical protein K431DRAFT_225149 [Polychaeton citri CBS 116435]|uniref:RNI-like protein n=1 Tax=Polychaeton citri CBS 116435 TaxID=1314669 RepID=A0A9P4Q7I9_9PEZI|nr:hypothetical protein K431DRAFT_225149 [Polychaeton citri CBS 116435]
MEAQPPSYSQATLVNYWDIIARYMPSTDLCMSSLVCSVWHATFSRHLWGNPASHFGLENDRVYVALTKFKRTLQTARLLVRSMTHTLHLPPAHAEIYYGPHSDWLRDTLDRLPNLQSLIVRGLPFFDHSALLALKQPSQRRVATQPDSDPFNRAIELPGSLGNVFERPSNTVPSFGLRLLDASRCPNVTSGGLALALNRFENLLYLDLSFTYPARDPQVLNALRKFLGLQVLKLRGIHLKDDGVGVLANAIGRRVRSVDLRHNQITDRGIRTLLDSCFNSEEMASGHTSMNRSPSLLPYLGSEILGIYQGESFEGYLRSAFTNSFVSRLAIEDMPEGGITHFYIANNAVTVEGISGLLRCKRLHVLDVGSSNADMIRHPLFATGNTDLQMPGMAKLTPTLESCAVDSLTFLRVDHSLITKDTPSHHLDETVSGRVELADTSTPAMPEAAELDSTPASALRFEVSAEPSTPRFELESDLVNLAITPPSPGGSENFVDEKEVALQSFRRGSAIAPEAIGGLATGVEQLDLLSPASAVEDGIGTMNSSLVSPMSPSASISQRPSVRRPRSYSSVMRDRHARLTSHKAWTNALHPAMIPKLRTLILTNVPPFSYSPDEADRLVKYLKLCAEESQMAVMQAKLDYSLPPGRRGQANALRESAQKHFALRRIVLEMASEQQMSRHTQASPWQHAGKSMTEDRDSEALWNAAETDFSFFGEEEDMFPSIESGRFAFSSGEKEVSVGDNNSYGSNAAQLSRPAQQSQEPEAPKFDNIAFLSRFRKERKMAHERNLAAGAVDPETEGFWDGLIQVVRLDQKYREDEELDYYGNVFSVGYLYR